MQTLIVAEGSSKEVEESSESKGLGEKDLVLRNLMQRSKYFLGDICKRVPNHPVQSHLTLSTRPLWKRCGTG